MAFLNSRAGLAQAAGAGAESAGRGLLLLAWLLALLTARAAPAVSAEYQLKAVFLFNFTQFIEWPRQAFASPEAPLVIGVLGEDPFGRYLDDTVSGEKINGRRLEIRRYRSVEEVGACQILFISASEALRVREIVARLRGRSVVTVGDFEGFVPSGGMIRFLTERGRIRLRVNLDAARAAGVTISSKLLRAAEVVTSGGE